MIETGKGYFGELCRKLGLPVWLVLAGAGILAWWYLKRKK